MDRNLDGIYFRVKRNEKWNSICFSDLTEAEMDEILLDKDIDFLKKMCKILGNTIKSIGNNLDIMGE